jgi:hypothetical protein
MNLHNYDVFERREKKPENKTGVIRRKKLRGGKKDKENTFIMHHYSTVLSQYDDHNASFDYSLPKPD